MVIANGQQFATIDVAGVIDDGLLEGDETVIVTLTGTDYRSAATIDPANDADTVTIADDETTLVSITANDPNAAEARV